MSASDPFKDERGRILQTTTYLERPRLNKLLETASKYPLVAIYAGSGYGKTRMVKSFLSKQDAPATWMQITESDNIIAHFWEKYVNIISTIWPESAARLREIGIPDTDDGFAKYAAVRSDTLAGQGKCYFVYDDFHLLHNPVLLHIFEKIISSIPQNGTVIVISRTIPELNLTSYMMRERIYTIREDELGFTEDEIAEYFNQLELSVSRQDIRDVYDDTHGWAFAINLIGRSLGKDLKYERSALEAMKDNIFKLIELETLDNISDGLWRFLLRISLIDHLAASLIRLLADDEKLLSELDKLNAYVRYDYHLGAYMIHELFLAYLRQHQQALSDDEREDTYNKAGFWCEENDYRSDALAYYERAGNYEAIMRMISSMNIQMTQDIADQSLEIFNRMPKEIADNNNLFPAMYIKINLSLGMYDETTALIRRYAEDWGKRPESPGKNRALAEIYGMKAISGIIMSPFTDKYDFDAAFKTHNEYFAKNPYSMTDPTIKQSVGAYALLVGSNRAGATEEFIDAMSSAISCSSEIYRKNLLGLDDLSRGELLFYRREFIDAEQYLHQALEKARMNGQFSIYNRALLILMLLSFARGDLDAANSIIKQIEAQLGEKEYVTRYDSYDIARGDYFLALGQPEQIPDWLKADFSPYSHPAFLANYANRVKANYCYMTRQYNTLLAFFENLKESNLLLVGKIMFKTLEALSLYQLKRREEAIVSLTEAYKLAESNKIIVLFTQYGKDMRTLTAAALKSENCSIPKPWLEDINRKSSAFARRQAHMATIIKSAAADDAKPVFTKREIQILKELSQGLSRSEIAENQGITVNTVKMVINSIYDKLGVKSLHDALRIAIASKLI
ncbi:MAG: LuxR C-terminal-related transcriptional regulator [Oscillospiraceae bacterium]|nr:LuxR C-terminal-related transcriptional regulator [Oscillospiraceae bacterium]